MMKTTILLALAFAAPSFAARDLAEDVAIPDMSMICPNPPEGTTAQTSMEMNGVITCLACPTGETGTTVFDGEVTCTCSGGNPCINYTP